MVSTIANRLRLRLLFLPTGVMNVTARKQLAAKQKSINAIDSKNIGEPVPETTKPKGASKPAKKVSPPETFRGRMCGRVRQGADKDSHQVSFSSLGDPRADLH